MTYFAKGSLFILVLAAAISLITYSACTEDMVKPAPIGNLTANFNGESWSAEPFAVISKDTLISIQANIADEFGLLREHLGLGLVPFRVGSYCMKDTSVHSDPYLAISIFSYQDHDVALATYRLSSTAENILTIKDYDQSTNIVSGEFNVTFELKNNFDSLDIAETLIVTNGEFQALIIE